MRTMPPASAFSSRAGTINPIPVALTASRAPGISVHTTGVPQNIASICVLGKQSLRLGSTNASHML